MRIRKFALWILVEHLQIRMRRRRIEIVVLLLHILAVIALAVGQAEEPLFENGIARIPQRHAQAQALLVVGKPADAVLAPAVGATPCMIVREVFPRGAVGAVVLARRAPLALGEIRAPSLPPRCGGVFRGKARPL